MKALPIALLLLSTVVTTATLAQAGDGQTSAVEETQEAAKAQAVASSFEGLQPILKVGQEVTVQDEAGQATQGKVVSISNNQLVITRLQDWRLEELAFSEDFVRRIDVADSVWWPGAVVGAPHRRRTAHKPRWTKTNRCLDILPRRAEVGPKPRAAPSRRRAPRNPVPGGLPRP